MTPTPSTPTPTPAAAAGNPPSATPPRPLHVIAADICDCWRKVNYAARPYLDALLRLDKITDYYGADDAVGIVAYFLSNATTWRGPDAKRIKAELKAILAEGTRRR